METIQSKCCGKCKIEKPFNEFGKGKDKFGLRHECKKCRRNGRKWKWEMSLEQNKKICSSCKIEKSFDDFGLDKNNKDGKNCYCFSCVKEKSLFYANKNHEKKKNSALNYSRSKKAKINNEKKYNENPRKCNFINCNSIITFDNRRKYFCSDECREKTKKEQQKRINEKIRIRLKTDSFFKLKTDIRRTVFMAIQKYLKTNKTNLGKNTLQLIGCSWEELKLHLEKQFTSQMNWENHGIKGWHIDHHIPLSSAKTEEEVYKLNHYTNLKPLWWKDNLKKSDKISEEWGNA